MAIPFSVKSKSGLVKGPKQKGGIAMKKSKTKKLKRINGKTIIVAVDIGKMINTGYCRCPDGTEVDTFEFYNNGRGFHSFWSVINQVKKAKNLDDMVVGIESTGPYGEPLLNYLRKRSVRLVQVNPMHTKRLKELQGNSPNKTDKKDPKVIADIIGFGHSLTVVVPEGASAELRRLTHARERAIKRRNALYNQLHDLVFTVFPEFIQVMKSVKTKSARYLLQNWPTPQCIVRYGLESLSKTLKQVSRGRMDEKRAQALYEGALQSVGITEGSKSIIFEIKEILTFIEAVNRFIGDIEKRMTENLNLIPYSKSILSIRGIGKVTTAGLIGEVGDFSKFNTIAEVTKLAGLDLFEISSGQHKGKRRISKRGRPIMRKLLYFASLNIVRRGGIFYETYQSYVKRGMIRTKALIAVARKLLRTIFAIVRDHGVFNPNYTVILKEAA
jgi:transposase